MSDPTSGPRTLTPGSVRGSLTSWLLVVGNGAGIRDEIRRESKMTERSLQVTYRKGKPFSAYLHLSHQTGEKSARTVPSADGLLVVDHGQNGKAIGVEITAPSAVPLDRVNRVLADLGETPLSEHDYLPVRAA